jgi:hypothetical protein
MTFISYKQLTGNPLKRFWRIQDADNKLGQFLGQDIEARANHRNVLRHSLESYSSLVSRDVSKPSLDTKICRQSTKLLQLSKKLCAPRRDQQGIEKFLKVHRSLVYLFKDSFISKPGYWGGRCHSCPKLRAFGLTRTVDFVATPNSAKITQDWLKAEGPLVPGNLASQLKRL